MKLFHCIIITLFSYWIPFFQNSEAFHQVLRQNVYINCEHGNDTSTCGLHEENACKTLQFLINTRAKMLAKTDHVVVYIASGVCNDSSVVVFGYGELKVKSWTIIGSNK